MKTIQEQLESARKQKKIGLMTHVVAGYPTLEDTFGLVLDMQSAGADFVEIQIPFSDPIADGPVIMEANTLALKNGIATEDCFDVAKRLSKNVDIPLLFMGYFNTVFRKGIFAFAEKCRAVGIQGLIIPDIPVDEEENDHFIAACEKNGIHHISVLSPTSTNERIALNAKHQDGFVYCTAYAGTTGGKSVRKNPIAYVKQVRRHINVPIALGFGIKTPEDVQKLVGVADIAVVGSAIISRIQTHGIKSVESFVRELASAGEK